MSSMDTEYQHNMGQQPNISKTDSNIARKQTLNQVDSVAPFTISEIHLLLVEVLELDN